MGFGQYSQDGLGGPNKVYLPKSEKRQRTTFGTHSNTAHVWAQQAYENGKSSDGRIFFRGPSIYSYGTHFKIAEFTKKKQKDGKQIVLFTERSYSSSTGGHKNDARGALRGLPVVIVDVPSLDGWTASKSQVNDVLESYIAKIADGSSWRFDESVHGSFDAFRKAYAPKFKPPKDFAVHVKAKHEKEALAEARKESKPAAVIIRKAARVVGDYVAKYATIPADATESQLSYDLGDIQRNLTILRCNRATLSKAGVLPTVRAMASATIKVLTPVKDKWLAAHEAAVKAKAHNAQLKLLDTVENDMQIEDATWSRQIAQHWPHLWAFAIAENRSQELIGFLARQTHAQAHAEWLGPMPMAETVYLSPDEWRNGKHGKLESCYRYGMAETWVRRKGDQLETSRGAEVPWKHAVIAFRKAQDCRTKGQPWETNGHKLPVGTFQVDRIEADGSLKAGCHTIAYDEMLTLAVREIPHDVRPCFPLPVPMTA